MTQTSLNATAMKPILAKLAAANDAFARTYPGEAAARQPVHTVYGAAHLFKHDAARKLGDLALASLREYAPNFAVLARAVGMRGAEGLPESGSEFKALFEELLSSPESVRRTNPAAFLAHMVYTRVMEKLEREPVEDFRIDFEDGYGTRADAEEDACAAQCAQEVAMGMRGGTLPPFIGIRVKTFSREMHARGIRTLDVFLTALSAATGGKLPSNFVVTLPKVVAPEQVSTLVDLFELIEKATAIRPGALKLELMIETTQSIIDPEGRSMLPLLVAAARGRCVGAHFGVYDYTASCNITAEHQHMVHPACDFARDMMQVALTGMGIALSDGATNIMPVAPHRAVAGQHLSVQQVAENRASVHRAWRLHYEHIRHSLARAYYQGWDLNPAQLPTRYAAVYSFFLEAFEPAAVRLKNFVEKAARATLAGGVFDDAATAQGLLTFFLQGLRRGALTEAEVAATGLTAEEMGLRSFAAILERRTGR
jgi:citrate lyase beta subunit